jgi:hypothetical protein
MRASRNLLRSASLGIVLSLLVSVPGLGQSLPMPCSAFARSADGGWKVLAPVMLEIDGRLLGPIVGTSFEPGSVANGIKISEVLDRECQQPTALPVSVMGRVKEGGAG